MTIEFQPLLPWLLIALLAAGALALVAFGLHRNKRGMALRAATGFLLLAALANPLLLDEDRQPLSTLVAIAVDRSSSQQVGNRARQSDQAIAALKTAFAPYKTIELRFIDVGAKSDMQTPSTRVFEGVASALDDVPPARIGGVIIISDGQVHDVPQTLSAIPAPVHTLLTGLADEFDRRIEIIKAPRFSIVNKEQELVFSVMDDGPVTQNMPVDVTLTINGKITARSSVTPGAQASMMLSVPRAGANVVELSVATVLGEVTPVNNRILHMVDGIRENLRVLLVSGEPHAGERSWRNLLKSDASVDLVHFTILRPPEKQDGTPISELSLIAFPTQELFAEKIKDFDLIIFDRYQHRGVLPLLYYDNIAQYVKDGGALLLVSGPEHAGNDSIATTPLADILPASPTGSIQESGFYPRLSPLGTKHPVTRDLEGSDTEPPRWGRWFRSLDVNISQGETVMTAGGKPLLVLDRVGDGRVAMLLSDQGWLWARGLEGGGPHVDLYRRISHWLMQEPILEEEALSAHRTGNEIEVTRQTIGSQPGPALIQTPSGKTITLALAADRPGLYRGRLKAIENGLYEISNDKLTALVHQGAVDAPGFHEMVSTTKKMQPIAAQTGGLIKRLSAATGDGVTLPQILTVNGPLRGSDPDRMRIRMSADTVLKGIASWPLFAGLLGLALLLSAISATWWREGR